MATLADSFAEALAYHQGGDLSRAEALYRQIIQADPYFAQAHNNLGILLKSRGQLDQAVACYRQALRANPRHAGARNNLGNALREQGNMAEAIACYQQALEINPQLADVANNLGNALQQAGATTNAIACYHQALRVNPHHAETFLNLGLALKDQGDLAGAVDSYRQALCINPQYVDAHHCLSIALARLGMRREAQEHNEAALRLNPAHTPALWQRSLARLLEGDFESGWKDYDQRLALPKMAPRLFAQPRWDGAPLAGKTILIHYEEGLGDTIQFARYVPMVQERGGRVVFECQRMFLSLMGSLGGYDELIPAGAPLPAFDVHVPLLSLPVVFGTTLNTIPAPIPYLHADLALMEHWRRELAPIEGFKVGIAWQGNPNNTKDRQRSMPLAHFGLLARIERVHLISLQKGPGASQLRDLAGPFPVLDWSDRLETVLDTAALIMNLDLVIAPDTFIPHLAGALGAPVWTMLPIGPDWRWLLERADSPWYPTMRLFRQKQPGDWGEVFERVAAELGGLVQV